MIVNVCLICGFAGLIGLASYRICCKPFDSLFKKTRELENLSKSDNLKNTRTARRNSSSFVRKFANSSYVTFASGAINRIAPQSLETQSSMRLKLDRAGISLNPTQWRVCCVSICLLTGALCAAIAGFTHASLMTTALAAAIGFLFTWVASSIFLRSAIKRRQGRLMASFPNAIELLAAMIQAGCPLERGIFELGKQEHAKSVGEITHEFTRVTKEMNHAGVSLEDALNNMIRRCDLPEITAAISAILQAYKQGASIGAILNRQARACRKAYFSHIQSKINRTEVWVIIPLGCCFVPAMIVIAMAPTISVLLEQLPSLF